MDNIWSQWEAGVYLHYKQQTIMPQSNSNTSNTVTLTSLTMSSMLRAYIIANVFDGGTESQAKLQHFAELTAIIADNEAEAEYRGASQAEIAMLQRFNTEVTALIRQLAADKVMFITYSPLS